MSLAASAPVFIFFVIALLGNWLHCAFRIPLAPWGDVLPSLYYLPVVAAGIRMGAAAAIGVALAGGASHAVASAFGCGDSWSRVLMETALLVCAGAIAARMTQFQAVRPGAGAAGHRGASIDPTHGATQRDRQIPALTQIVTRLVHRFRTPVSSIEGAAWLLEDGSIPEEKRGEFVGIIRKESGQLDRALSEVLEFMRPQEPRFRETDLTRLLDEFIQRTTPKEKGPPLLLHKDDPSDSALVWCDPDQVRRLLYNLATNAIQATSSGGAINFSVHPRGDDVVISVKDQGRGIQPKVLTQIFDPFFTTRENSLGLGLTVAQQIAEAHGGSIIVEDTSENGTCITVALPIKPPKLHERRSNTGS
jgi:signal transduction histidine kinase